jgi:hypothetical protein
MAFNVQRPLSGKKGGGYKIWGGKERDIWTMMTWGTDQQADMAGLR